MFKNYMRLNMRILKKMIVGLILAANSSLLCDEVNKPTAQAYDGRVKNDYSYFGCGAGFPNILSAKLGHRYQLGKHGFDFGVGATPLVIVMEAHLYGNYLYYPKPNLSSQMYFGIGLQGGFEIYPFVDSPIWYIGPQIIVGHEFTTRNGERPFIQLAVGPAALTTQDLVLCHSISVTIGYGF